MALNDNLNKAKRVKDDEFYTMFEDVSAELENYGRQLNGMSVLCNCGDDVSKSSFWKYFHINFGRLGIKELRAINFNTNGSSYYVEYFGGNDDDIMYGNIIPLIGDGDFRSDECVNLLKSSDIVSTNPPFSLFREYISQLMKYEKKFIVLGNKNAITYKDFFPLIRDNKVWTGYNNVHRFIRPDGTIRQFGNIGWYTNLEVSKHCEKIKLHKRYYDDDGIPLPDVENIYPHYDNFDAINIDRVSDIPCDYFGIMGVPISFIDKYNPSQMKIIGADYEYAEPVIKDDGTPTKTDRFYITRDGERKRMFSRVLIQQNNVNAADMFEVIGVINHGSDGEWDLCKCEINGKERYKRIAIKRRCV